MARHLDGVAGAQQPRLDRRGRAVAHAGDHRRAGRQAGRRGGRSRHLTHHLGARPDRRHLRQIEAHPVGQRLVVAQAPAVEEEGQRPVRHVHADRAAQLVDEIAVRLEHGVRIPIHVRLMLSEPQPLRGEIVGIDPPAVDAGDRRRAHALPQPRALGLGAAVEPEQRGAKRCAAAIHRHDARRLAADADAGNRARIGAGRDEKLRQDVARGAPPLLRVLLGPVRMRVDGGVFPARLRQDRCHPRRRGSPSGWWCRRQCRGGDCVSSVLRDRAIDSAICTRYA